MKGQRVRFLGFKHSAECDDPLCYCHGMTNEEMYEGQTGQAPPKVGDIGVAERAESAPDEPPRWLVRWEDGTYAVFEEDELEPV